MVGDIHGEFGKLNSFINKYIRLDVKTRALAEICEAGGKPLEIIILQCGDFGFFWPDEDNQGKIRNKVDFLKEGHVPIYWVGGNHEDWDRLDALGTEISEVDAGVFFCPFGTTLEIAPDMTVLFAGGARSNDIEWRLEKMEQGGPKIWWEQEIISDEDMARLDCAPKADMVISHTAPKSFDMRPWMPGKLGQIGMSGFIDAEKTTDPSMEKLDVILEKYRPKKWFFGHFHLPMSGVWGDCARLCEWRCIPDASGNRRFWHSFAI